MIRTQAVESRGGGEREFYRELAMDDTVRRKALVGIDFGATPAQERIGLIVRDAEDPGRKPGDILEFFEILVRLQESVLREIQSVLAAVDQAEDVIVHTTVPSGDEEIECVHVTLPRFVNQVGIFNRPKDQLSAPVVEDAGLGKKDGMANS